MRTYLIGWLCVSLGAAALVAVGQDQPKPPAKPKAAAKAKPKPKAKTPAKPKDEGPALPVLADAPVTNAYAFYAQGSFDFVLDRHLRATIYPKEKGEHVGKPVKLSAPLFVVPGSKNPPKSPAKLVEFLDPPAPKLQAAEFEISGKLSNDALIGVKYKFVGNTVNLSCWVRNAPAAESPTPVIFEFGFPTTHTFTPNIEMAERKKAVEGWYIKTREKGDKDKNFKSFAYTYWDMAKFKKDAQSLEVFGPWGTRKFVVHEVGSGVGNFSLESPRGHRYPYTGFEALYKVPTSMKKKTDSTTLAITIE
jgi:hypothetical protein